MRNNRYDKEIQREQTDTLKYHAWDKEGFGVLCNCCQHHAIEMRLLTHPNKNKIIGVEPRKGREFFYKWRPQ